MERFDTEPATVGRAGPLADGPALLLLVLVTVAMATMLGACGGHDDGEAVTGKAPERIEGAKVIDPKSMDKATGNVTYCAGKDTVGDKTNAVKQFNARFGAQGLSVKLFEFPASADEARNQFVQRQTARSADCDVFAADVIWTAEFATQKWIYDLTPYIRSRQDEFIQSTLDTGKLSGSYWGVPRATAAAFLYYRTDKIGEAPQTWQEVYQQAEQKGGFVYQGASYEGLTVDFLEVAFAAGGQVLSPDGKKSIINSPENLKALRLMVDGVKSGAAPRAVTTFMEEEARRAFEGDRAVLMRNWPYAYALGNKKGSKIAGKFEVTPEPAFEGGGKAGILGGENMVLSVYSKNPGGALKFIDFATSLELQNLQITRFSDASVLNASYDDPAVAKALPFTAELKQAIAQARTRPVSQVYPQISAAIYKNVNQALSGAMSPEEALKKADGEITKALATF